MHKRAFVFSGLVVAAAAGILFYMGRIFFCACGHISLWQGVVASPENSQQLSDWYSASHFIHGILFFWFFGWVVYYVLKWFSSPSERTSYTGSREANDRRFGYALILSTLVEAGWEILENSPIIINRYREATISLGYTGDSILNSVSDIMFMWFGFIFAKYVPWWVSLGVIIFLELFVGYMIRDNLALNILMLVYPSPAVRAWQAG